MKSDAMRSNAWLARARPTALLVAVLFALAGCEAPPLAASTPRGEILTLPAPSSSGTMPLEAALARRRSIRSFTAEPLTTAELSQLVWAAQGITDPSRGYRSAPSAGALFPLELYLVKADGIFHYLPHGHRLERVAETDQRAELASAAYGQDALRRAALDLVIVGVLERTRVKYGARAEAFVNLEAGHAAQNLLLEATAMGLGAVPIGGFEESALARALPLAPGETPLYIVSIGHPRQ